MTSSELFCADYLAYFEYNSSGADFEQMPDVLLISFSDLDTCPEILGDFRAENE